jgi:single-strand DNA-binding protein
MARSLNRATLIGNLTRDPELRYTPQGTAVCTFTVATNRQWKTESGEQKDDAEFHRVVAWDKLAEICGQMLTKGNRVFVEGRIQTRKWEGQDGQTRYTTEIVISDMLLLDRKGEGGSEDYSGAADDLDVPADFGAGEEAQATAKPKKAEKKQSQGNDGGEEDIPF